MNIREDYCSFEVAKLLKEKGFLKGVDLRLIPNLAFYDNIGLRHNVAKWYDSLIQDKIDFVVAPTHQMAWKWLREKHIIMVVQPEYFNGGAECSYWGVDIWADDNYEKLQGDFPSYEEAVEAALKYSLENLI